jgi:hypothetical protein
MPGSTVTGGTTHGMPALSEVERHAARGVLEKLKQSSAALGPHLGRGVENATVSSGSALSMRASTVGLGASTLLSARGSDTFMGGVRSAPLSSLHIGTDTVVSGSTNRLRGQTREALGARGVQHFALTSDTINIAGATATSIKAGHTHSTTSTHTVTLADKTTIKIAGLSEHDISKLHH